MYHFCKALVLWQFDNVEYGGSTSFVKHVKQHSITLGSG